MSDPINWTERGIAWERIAVSKQSGPHATDAVAIGNVWAPRLVATKDGIDAAVAHFNAERVASWINGSSSFDVRARSWYKSKWSKNRDAVKMTDDEMKLAVYNAVLLSAGGRGRTVEREIHLVIGSFSRVIRGGETVTYAELFGAAMATNIDAMPDAPVAFLRSFVANTLEKAGFSPDAEEAEITNE
jgi:hypothetical protein